jgi:hypothetical protein
MTSENKRKASTHTFRLASTERVCREVGSSAWHAQSLAWHEVNLPATDSSARAAARSDSSVCTARILPESRSIPRDVLCFMDIYKATEILVEGNEKCFYPEDGGHMFL